MYFYKIIIAYDGSNYYGWQEQKDKPSIAQVLQDSFKDVFNLSIRLFGVSRTDAGVHALGQVAAFKTTLDLDPKKIQWAWSNSLPEDIVIRSLERVEVEFNPHRNVAYKTYVYHLFIKQPSPFISRYGWYVRKNIDLEKLQATLRIFIGTHDFRSFSTGDDRGHDTIRTIESITIKYLKRYNAYALIIKGPKFLRYMVRRIVGAAIASATNPALELSEVQRILDHKNPQHTLPTAPAKGLVLYKIRYTSDV